MSPHDSPCSRNRNATYKVTHVARVLELSLKLLGRMIEKLGMLDIHKTVILSINIILQQLLELWGTAEHASDDYNKYIEPGEKAVAFI